MIADFCFGFGDPRLYPFSSVQGYGSMLAAVFWSNLPDISSAQVLRDLIRSFTVETPTRPIRPPS